MGEMYKNFGDVNFFDTGILVKEISEREFHIMTCSLCMDSEENGPENDYAFSIGTVMVDDYKDHFDSVCKEYNLRGVSIDYTDDEYMSLAAALFQSGYADYDCYSQYRIMSKNAIIDFIDHGYINEIEWEFYETNFYESHRNCVVEFHNAFAQSEKRVYDSLEDALEDFETRAEKGWSLEVVDK